jgi:hypothetical protein
METCAPAIKGISVEKEEQLRDFAKKLSNSAVSKQEKLDTN